MAYGIKISKSGKSASSSDVLDLVISTQYPVHKVKVEGENSLTLGSSDTTKSYTITHNLGYKAITWVFIDD
ncbi:hypothetical protein KC614_04485, partial [candidate division WWE3 bacterium]|nr:hypothetical protein [candidate division WWE3 bacterium]